MTWKEVFNSWRAMLLVFAASMLTASIIVGVVIFYLAPLYREVGIAEGQTFAAQKIEDAKIEARADTLECKEEIKEKEMRLANCLDEMEASINDAENKSKLIVECGRQLKNCAQRVNNQKDSAAFWEFLKIMTPLVFP